VRGVDPDHKICNPHKIIKVGINLEEERERKSKLDLYTCIHVPVTQRRTAKDACMVRFP